MSKLGNYVVSRCSEIHAHNQGFYLRGVVAMRDGRFYPGTEELFEPDSLEAMSFNFPETPAHLTIQEAKTAANARASAEALASLQAGMELPEEFDISKSIISIEESRWVTVDVLVEAKTHIGKHQPVGEPAQFFGGIEVSHRGGESDIHWNGPFSTKQQAVGCADQLMKDEIHGPENLPPVRPAPALR